jgi:ABC-2 type transport system permease protein
VENLLRAVSGVLGPFESMIDYLPGTAAGSLAAAAGVAIAGEPGGAPGVVTTLSGTVSVAVLSGYLAVFVGLAALLMTRRDA